MLAIYVPKLRSSEMVTPKYLAADTLSSSILGGNGGLKPGDRIQNTNFIYSRKSNKLTLAMYSY